MPHTCSETRRQAIERNHARWPKKPRERRVSSYSAAADLDARARRLTGKPFHEVTMADLLEAARKQGLEQRAVSHGLTL